MADFRPAPGLCTYSGGTVPELHRIVYSPPTPDRRREHSGFDKNMIRQFHSFVKKRRRQYRQTMTLRTDLHLSGAKRPWLSLWESWQPERADLSARRRYASEQPP